MREQPSLLKHITDLAAPRRHEDAARRVGQHLAIEHDSAPLWADEPGNRIDERCLAGSRAPEQRRDAAAALERSIEPKIAERMLDRDAQHCQNPSVRRVARSIRASEANSATIEITMETRVSRNAARSPPGVWIKA